MTAIVIYIAFFLLMLGHAAIQYYGWYRMHMEYYLNPSRPFKLFMALIFYTFAVSYSGECISEIMKKADLSSDQTAYWILGICCFGLPSLFMYILARRDAKRRMKLDSSHAE